MVGHYNQMISFFFLDGFFGDFCETFFASSLIENSSTSSKHYYGVEPPGIFGGAPIWINLYSTIYITVSKIAWARTNVSIFPPIFATKLHSNTQSNCSSNPQYNSIFSQPGKEIPFFLFSINISIYILRMESNT